MDESQARAASWDSSIAHPARRYNYWLGGKDNFAADRASGDAIEKMYPTIRLTVVENRAFLRRVVEFLAGEGVDQFLDIGAGLPAADNTHEVAQRINPAGRVVYVDNDPMVMSHVRALLTSTPEGASCYLEHDLRQPDRILADPGLRDTLDLRRPVALLLMAVVHFVADDQQATECVQHLIQALPPGSYVAISHCTIDHAEEYREAYFAELAKGTVDSYPRSRSQLGDLLTGTTLLDPGIVPITHWRSPLPPDERLPLDQVALYGAVARKD